MKKIIDKKNIEASCSYCAHGKFSPLGETILCQKKGIVEKDFYCKKFKYDVLKRQPRRPREIDHFDAEAFTLNIEE